ncbi:MAG TPA: hypothetical protein VJA40_02395 [archaeon]|nr:hypothetical protein [archaeon]
MAEFPRRKNPREEERARHARILADARIAADARKAERELRQRRLSELPDALAPILSIIDSREPASLHRLKADVKRQVELLHGLKTREGADAQKELFARLAQRSMELEERAVAAWDKMKEAHAQVKAAGDTPAADAFFALKREALSLRSRSNFIQDLLPRELRLQGRVQMASSAFRIGAHEFWRKQNKKQ